MSQVRPFFRNARNGIEPDNHQIAQCRVHLKLAALAFGASRTGADAFPEDGVRFLCAMALRYVRALAGRLAAGKPDPILKISDEYSAHLKLAALAYVESRHGADMGQGFTRDGMALLLQAAISYVQRLPGEDYAADVTDTGLITDGR